MKRFAAMRDNVSEPPMEQGSTRALQYFTNSARFVAPILEDMTTTEGDSALDYACANSHVEVARALIAAGADVNAQDERGWGALHNSCSKFNSKSIELIELLLESGANSLILNSDAQTPYDISREKSVKSLLKISMDLAQADIDFLDGGMEF